MASDERRLAAIVCLDVAGYSRLMEADEAGTLAALKAQRRTIEPIIATHSGRIVKSTGDGLLLEFASTVGAVRAAIEIQTRLASVPPTEAALEFRIGVNQGDVIVEGDDIFGDGVNVAARLQELAEPGGVCLSARVYEDVRGRVEAAFLDGGERTLKNIARPVRVWRWTATAEPLRAGVPLPLPDKPSVAVLPFDNMSGDPEQAYFADGMAEDLITALSRVSWLFVIARNSSFSFRGQKLEVRTIASKLGVRYLVEGSIRRAGGRVRITAQLIEAASGAHIWADRYDGTLDDIFDLQDRIVASIMGAIEPKLRATEIARARRKRPDSLDAFDLVLQALPHLAGMTHEDFDRAEALLDRALALAPGYAQALAYSAHCRAHRPLHGWSADPVRDLRSAMGLARRGIAADPDDPVALRSAGIAAVFAERDYHSAWDFMDRSLVIDPNSALTWGFRGWTSMWAGEPEAAIRDFDKALRLSPFDQWISVYSLGRAFALNTSDRFEEGLVWARRALQENPNWIACHRQLIAGLALIGRMDEARAAVEKHVAIDANFSVRRWVENGPFRRTPNQERFFDALRSAGLAD